MTNVATSLVAEKPKVLILSAASEFCTALQELFAAKNLLTTVVDPHRLIEYLDAGRSVLPDKYYKIVWAYGFASVREDFTKIIHFLRRREEPILILSTVAPQIEADQEAFADWAARAQQDHLFLLQASLNLPAANLIFAEEAISTDNLVVSSLGAMSTAQNGVLLDPQMTFHLTTAKTFLSQVEDRVFNPFTNQKFFYHGQTLSSRQVLEIINQVASERLSHTYQVVEAPVRRIADNFPFSFEIIEDYSDAVTGIYNLLATKIDTPAPAKTFSASVLPEIILPTPAATSVKVEVIDLPLPDNKLPGAPPRSSILPPPNPEPLLEAPPEPVLLESAPEAPALPATETNSAPIDPKVTQFLLENDFLDSLPDLEASENEFKTDSVGDFANKTPQPDTLPNESTLPDFSQLPILPINQANQQAFEVAKLGPEETEIFVTDDMPPSAPEIVPPPSPQKIQIPPEEKKAESLPPETETTESKTADSPTPARRHKSKSTQKTHFWQQPPLLISLLVIVAVGIILALMTVFSGNSYKKEINDFLVDCQDLLACEQTESYARLATTVARQQRGFWQILPGHDDDLLAFGQQIVTTFEHRAFASNAMFVWHQGLTGRRDEDMAVATNELNAALDTWLESVSALREEFLLRKDTFLTAQTAPSLAIFENNLTALRQDITLLSRLMPALHDLVSQEKYTLALNLMDNRVLRSGGGLAAGVSILDFESGKLTGQEFFSAQDIDTQLGGEILLADAITSISPDIDPSYANLFWDLDGLADATMAASLLEKVIDRPITGLAAYTALNSQLDLIDNFTPRPGYILDGIDELNFDENIVQLQQQLSFQFRNLSPEPFINSIPPDELTPFLLALARAFGNKDIYWFSFDGELAARLAELGFDNRPTTPTCPLGLGGDVCVLETFYQVDNNLNPNFNNQDLVRTITHNIELLPALASHERTIAYQNNSPTASYSAYIRFLLPPEANSPTLTIDGVPAALDDSNGTQISVPANEVAIVKLVFAANHDFGQDGFTYSFFNQRQPGVIDSELAVNVRNSLAFAAKRLAPTATIDGKRFRFSSQEESDFLLGIAF